MSLFLLGSSTDNAALDMINELLAIPGRETQAEAVEAKDLSFFPVRHSALARATHPGFFRGDKPAWWGIRNQRDNPD